MGILTVKTMSLTLVHLVPIELVAPIGGLVEGITLLCNLGSIVEAYSVGSGPSEGHTIGLPFLPSSSRLAYHRLGGFEGTNFVDLDSCSPYYLGFGGWVDRSFVGHCFAGYLGDNYPTFLLGSVDSYHRRMPKAAGSVGSCRMAASRGSYDNFPWGDYLHSGCTPLPSQSNTYLAPKCEPYCTWDKFLCRCSGLDSGRGLAVDGEVGL